MKKIETSLNEHLEILLDTLLDAGCEDEYDALEARLRRIEKTLMNAKHKRMFWEVSPNEIVKRLIALEPSLDYGDWRNALRIIQPELDAEQAEAQAAEERHKAKQAEAQRELDEKNRVWGKQREEEQATIKKLLAQYEPADEYDPKQRVRDILQDALSKSRGGYGHVLQRETLPDLERRIAAHYGEFSMLSQIDLMEEIWAPRLDGREKWACRHSDTMEQTAYAYIAAIWGSSGDSYWHGSSGRNRTTGEYETSSSTTGASFFCPKLVTDKPFSEYIAWRRAYTKKLHGLLKELAATIKNLGE